MPRSPAARVDCLDCFLDSLIEDDQVHRDLTSPRSVYFAGRKDIPALVNAEEITLFIWCSIHTRDYFTRGSHYNYHACFARFFHLSSITLKVGGSLAAIGKFRVFTSTSDVLVSQ